MQGEWINVAAADGASFRAYLAKSGKGGGPGILLCQEVFGVNAQMRAVADVFLPIADPRLILLLMHGEDSVGFFFILPDVGEGLKKAAGRLLPLGWWHILRSARRTGLVDFLGLGVVPQFQSNGANMAIYCAVARKALDFPRYRAAELIQVEEGNTRMQRNIAALGISWNRRHRVYGRALRDR